MLYTFYKRWGNNILLKYRKNGKSYSKKIDFYKPSIYTKAKDSDNVDAQSLFGFGLKRHTFDCLNDLRDHLKTMDGVSGYTPHGNSDIAQQFILEFYQGKMPTFTSNDIRCGALDIEVDAKEGFPEPSEAAWPINGITFHDSFTDTYYCIGDSDFVHDKTCKHIGHLNVVYTKCADEYELLMKMLEHFRDFAYDVTTGWNSEFFDMPYIVNRCYKIVGEDITKRMMSPFNAIRLIEVNGNFGKKQLKAEITGLPHLDYQELYKKHNFKPRESFKLDHIAKMELGEEEGKAEFDEESLSALYEKNPQLFYTYNIKDVVIIRNLEKRLGFMYISYILAYYTFSNYQDTVKTVKPWVNLIAKHLYNKGQIPPFDKKYESDREESFEGAFVHPTQVGKWRWALAIDLNSLYPMNTIQSNIGPETHVPLSQVPEELLRLRAQAKCNLDDLIFKRLDLSLLKKYDLCMAANYQFYRRDTRSCIAEIMDDLYKDRKTYKKKMLESEGLAEQAKADKDLARYQEHDAIAILNFNIQMALKILLNGGYGAIGNAHFLYYLIENAEAITLSGQLINKWTHERLNKLLNKIAKTENVNYTLAGDTDSIYLWLEPVVKAAGMQYKTDSEITDWLDNFHNTILAPAIKSWTDELCDYMNGVENKMVWEREGIASDAIFVRKKGYTMRVIDSEGVRYEKPKIKVVGLEAKKAAAFPAWSRKYLEECYTIALTGDEVALQKRVAEIEKEFYAMPINSISTPKGVSNVAKYMTNSGVVGNLYIKGTPKHVKAAIAYNHLCDVHKLNYLERIGEGYKMKMVELREPNPIKQPVIAFVRELPKEFDLHRYVDRAGLFKSLFIAPLEIFLTALKWNHEETVSLDSFFS